MRDLACDYVHVLTTLLLSQQTTFELHSLPVPTPMTLMGEQFRPRSASMPSMTMPSRPRRAAPEGDEAYNRHV